MLETRGDIFVKYWNSLHWSTKSQKVLHHTVVFSILWKLTYWWFCVWSSVAPTWHRHMCLHRIISFSQIMTGVDVSVPCPCFIALEASAALYFYFVRDLFMFTMVFYALCICRNPWSWTLLLAFLIMVFIFVLIRGLRFFFFPSLWNQQLIFTCLNAYSGVHARVGVGMVWNV